ncbi:DUF1427 family protein [Streptomyces poonensis]|uniref:DUF1427 family protein n=1 Tax=Streptomyces poonensis TaxID=68255 RepID=UPI0016755DF1|nr:DUF1427 family protein [Streptomyces poonensis]
MSTSVAARAFLRPAALSFTAGLLMGAVYWALDITSPAPPLIGLTGLAGIVLGERAATAVRNRLTRRPAAPPPAAEGGRPRVS